MSSITAATELRRPEFHKAWRVDGTGSVLSIVYLGDGGARLAFNSPADARAMAAECIKAAEAMEQLEAEGSDR